MFAKRKGPSVASAIILCGLFISSGILAFGINSATAQSSGKIQHLIFILQENHSFDNYFGTYPGANNLSFAPPCCPTSLTAGAQPAAIKPFHLNVTQPVFIVGDELPPGQMYPNASDDLTAGSNGDDVAP